MSSSFVYNSSVYKSFLVIWQQRAPRVLVKVSSNICSAPPYSCQGDIFAGWTSQWNFANLKTSFCTILSLTFASPSVVCFYCPGKRNIFSLILLRPNFLAHFAPAEALICLWCLSSTTSPAFCQSWPLPKCFPWWMGRPPTVSTAHRGAPGAKA